MTEVGIIPEDWKIVTIGDVINVFDGTHQTPHYVDVGVPFYSVENLTANNFTNTKFISEEEHALLTKKVKIEKGDVLMTRIGSVGDCKFIDWDVNASYYVSLALLKKKSDKISMKWFASMSKSTAFKESILSNSLQFAVPMKINLGEISKVKFAMPSIEEQNLIADKLVEFDDFVSKIELQISKKKKIKEGTMQQLLTGKKRLPGFDGDWMCKTIGECCSLFGRIGFRGYTKQDLVRKHEGAITFSPSNIYEQVLDISNCDYISLAKYEESPEIKVYNGDILFCKTASIGKCAIVRGLEEKATINPQFVVLKDFKCNNYFLYYVIAFTDFQDKVKSITGGSTIPTMSQEKLKLQKIMLPPSQEEQKAIATILSDMDTEIQALEDERDKYLLIKQGVMQDLLTGKTRLV